MDDRWHRAWDRALEEYQRIQDMGKGSVGVAIRADSHIHEDDALLREALVALKAIRGQAGWDEQTNPFQVARLAQIKGITLGPITKLEERLLRE